MDNNTQAEKEVVAIAAEVANMVNAEAAPLEPAPEPNVVEAIIQKTPQEQAQEYLNDEKNKKDALAMAIGIQGKVGSGWVNINRFMVKSKLQAEHAKYVIQTLFNFGHVITKEGTFADGHNQAGKTLYRVIVSKLDQFSAIDEIIEFHEKSIVALLKRKQEIEASN
jgi:hypothetical protein